MTMAGKRSQPALNQAIDSDYFRSSEFMRARRPELFSDSEVLGEARLSREVFECHLDTLTGRNTRPSLNPPARARQKLAMREYPEELTSALFACGSAYSDPWWSYLMSFLGEFMGRVIALKNRKCTAGMPPAFKFIR